MGLEEQPRLCVPQLCTWGDGPGLASWALCRGSWSALLALDVPTHSRENMNASWHIRIEHCALNPTHPYSPKRLPEGGNWRGSLLKDKAESLSVSQVVWEVRMQRSWVCGDAGI